MKIPVNGVYYIGGRSFQNLATEIFQNDREVKKLYNLFRLNKLEGERQKININVTVQIIGY